MEIGVHEMRDVNKIAKDIINFFLYEEIRANQMRAILLQFS